MLRTALRGRCRSTSMGRGEESSRNVFAHIPVGIVVAIERAGAGCAGSVSPRGFAPQIDVAPTSVPTRAEVAGFDSAGLYLNG